MNGLSSPFKVKKGASLKLKLSLNLNLKVKKGSALKNPTGTPAFTTGFGPKTVVAQKAKQASLRASLVIGSDCGGGGPISDALRPSFRVQPLVI